MTAPLTPLTFMDIAEFRRLGLLQEINRRILHPLGLALAVDVADDGTETLAGVYDDRQDPEGWYRSWADAQDHGLIAAVLSKFPRARRGWLDPCPVCQRGRIANLICNACGEVFQAVSANASLSAPNCPSATAAGRHDRCGLFSWPPRCHDTDGDIACREIPQPLNPNHQKADQP